MPDERERDTVPVTRLTLPAALAISAAMMVATTVLNVGGTYWMLRSDVRDTQTRMEFYARQLDAVQKQNSMLQQDVTEIREHDIADIKLALASAGLYRVSVQVTNHPNGGK